METEIEKKCITCAHFIQHYIKMWHFPSIRAFFKTDCGHCIKQRNPVRIHMSRKCSEWELNPPKDNTETKRRIGEYIKGINERLTELVIYIGKEEFEDEQ